MTLRRRVVGAPPADGDAPCAPGMMGYGQDSRQQQNASGARASVTLSSSRWSDMTRYLFLTTRNRASRQGAQKETVRDLCARSMSEHDPEHFAKMIAESEREQAEHEAQLAAFDPDAAIK